MPSRDYEEFIAGFNAHGVRYLVIGARAVAFHARPRATKDLDIWIDPTPTNARKALAALRQFFRRWVQGPALHNVRAMLTGIQTFRFSTDPSAQEFGGGDEHDHVQRRVPPSDQWLHLTGAALLLPATSTS
jgi:hypothetical protein